MTKLIGGNISDTPIKDISDGSAFSAGGGGTAPDLITLGSWGTASVITGTGWVQHKASVATAWANSGYSCGWILMSPTKWLNVARRNSDNALYYGVITLDAAGDVSTQGTYTALSDFTTNGAPVALRRMGDSTTNLLIGSGKTSATQRIELGEYALSGDTLTLQNSLLTQNTTNGAASDLRGFSIEVGTDYGVASVFFSGTAVGFHPFRITSPQAFGTLVNTSTAQVSSQDQAGMMSWKSKSTPNVFYFSTGLLTKTILTEANPPTLTESDGFAVQVGGWGYGTEATLSNRGLIVQPPTEETDGNLMFIAPSGIGGWKGEGNTFRMADFPNRVGINLGGYGTPAVRKFNRHNIDFVHVDTSGDWVRGVVIAAHPAAGTTGLTAIPLNVNPKDQKFTAGTPLQTTNLTPHQDAPCNFGAAYHADWTTSQILIACEDTAAAPSIIKLPITV
jgi:hypothetical protein